MRELCRYLLIPELPLEHRSRSVSRSAPCTGTVQPADRKARLASHKEANMEEHFLSQRGFVRRTRSNPLSWQKTVTNTHWLAHLGDCVMDWDFVSLTHVHTGIPTQNMTHTNTWKATGINTYSLLNRWRVCNLYSIMKDNCSGWFWKVTKFTFFKEYWQSSRERDEYVWTGPSPARAAFTQTMGCRCGSGPGPDEENKIARVGWGVEVRWAQTGRLLWDLVAEGHCSAEEKHNNNKKKNPTLPESFYMIMSRTIEWVGSTTLRILKEASPLRPGMMLSHLSLEHKQENKTMRVAEQVAYWSTTVCPLREITMAFGLWHIKQWTKG